MTCGPNGSTWPEWIGASKSPSLSEHPYFVYLVEVREDSDDRPSLGVIEFQTED